MELIANNTNAADSTIGFDFVTNITVGHLAAGTQIKKEQTLQEILYSILYKFIEYSVTFANTDLQVVTVEEGKAITRPENPIKDGFEFAGWYIDANFTTEYNFEDLVYSDLTIYAKWIEINTDPDEPSAISYLTGTFGNQDAQEWAFPYVEDWSEEEQEEISMHYVNNMTEYSVASEDDLVGRHGFAITTPFVEESNSLAAYGSKSVDPYMTNPAIVLPQNYAVTSWNTDPEGSSLSEQTVRTYELSDGRVVYYASTCKQQTGLTNTHYLNIEKI